MAANPNPARITGPMWAFWEAFQALEPTVRLGGIYALKPGYHSTRDDNIRLWSGNYSIRDPQDQLGPADKSAAIDLTFPDAQAGRYETIDRYSSRLLASGQDRDDPRGDFLREFFGQADADTGVEGWDFRYVTPSTSDSSHLWHIHISVSREHVDNPAAYQALLSILEGETVAQWRAGQEDDMPMYGVAPGNPTVWAGDGVQCREVRSEAGIVGGFPAVVEYPSSAAMFDRLGVPLPKPLDPALIVTAVVNAIKANPVNVDVDEAAIATAIAAALPKPLTEAQTLAVVVQGANIAEDR